MNIQIITSSYPTFKGDPGGTAGLFVQSFASELASQGHVVIVQPVARKQSYQTEAGVVIEPIPWGGGDQELASMNFFNPFNWLIFLKFFLNGKKCTQAVHKKYSIDRTLCMWIIPCGLFGYWIKKKFNKTYDVWALGSDVWKIRKIPFFGKYWIKKIVQNASGVYADGLKLSNDIKEITQKDCQFLPSTRQLPRPQKELAPLDPVDTCHMLFVGRYHKNKGPDLLISAIAEIEENIRKKLKIHLFGAGPLEAHLRKICERQQLADIITIHGPIKDQEYANYLSQVSFLIIPSRIESIPLVFSDAMQVNTPVIAMPVGDLKELISNFNCGLVADSPTKEALAKSIQKSFEIKIDTLKDGTKSACAQFNIAQTARNWSKKVEKIIALNNEKVTITTISGDNYESEASSPSTLHSRAWGNIISKAFDTQILYIIINERHRIQAHIFKAGPFRIAYLGFPVLRTSSGMVMSDIILDALQQHSYPFKIDLIKISLSAFGKEQIAKKPQHTTPETEITDLSSWKIENLPKKIQRDIKYSKNHGITIMPSDHMNYDPKILKFYVDTVKSKRGSLRYTDPYFRELFKQSKISEDFKFLTAFYENNFVGFGVFVKHDSTVFYLHGAIDHAYKSKGISDLIIYEGILWAQKAGALNFNFMASPEDQESLIKYKEKWGGTTRHQKNYELTMRPFKTFLFKKALVLHNLVQR